MSWPSGPIGVGVMSGAHVAQVAETKRPKTAFVGRLSSTVAS